MEAAACRRLFETHGKVEALECDDDLAQHLRDRGFYPKHAVAISEILEAHAGQPRYFANAGTGRRAPVIMVGRTQAGRVIVVPIEPTSRRGVWRPVTAFEANAHHRERYGRS
jgi:hypothetical protein